MLSAAYMEQQKMKVCHDGPSAMICFTQAYPLGSFIATTNEGWVQSSLLFPWAHAHRCTSAGGRRKGRKARGARSRRKHF